MSTETTPGAGRASGSPYPRPPAAGHDWEAISRLPEYRKLVVQRRRFVTVASAIALGSLAVYTLLVCYARDAMATEIAGGISLAYALAVAEMVLTAALGAAYVRVARRDYEPLERAVADAVARQEATR